MAIGVIFLRSNSDQSREFRDIAFATEQCRSILNGPKFNDIKINSRQSICGIGVKFRENYYSFL